MKKIIRIQIFLLLIACAGFITEIKAQPNVEELFKQAGESVSKGKYDEAIQNLTTIINANPNSYKAYLLRGICYWAKKEIEHAEIQKDPAKAYRMEAEVYSKLKPGEVPPKSQNSLNAIADLTKAIQLSPTAYSPYNVRGKVYLLEKDLEPAINDFQKVTELKPDYQQEPTLKGLKDTLVKTRNDYANSLTMRANYLVVMDGYAKESEARSGTVSNQMSENKKMSLELFRKAIQYYSPNDFFTFQSRGNCHRSLENWSAAISDYTEALKFKPNDIYTLNERAGFYQKLGQTQNALDEFARIIAIQNVPQNEKFYQNEAYFKRAKLYAEQEKLNEAIADFDKAIANNPKYYIAYFERGKIHAGKGNKQLARADFLKAGEAANLLAISQKEIDILDGKIKPEPVKPVQTKPTAPNSNSTSNLSNQLVWRKTHPTDIVNHKQILGFNAPGGKLNFLCRADYAGGVQPGIVLENKCHIGYAGKAVILDNFEIYLPADNPHFELIAKEGEKYIIGRESDGTPLYLCYLNYQNWWLPGKIVKGNCNYTWQGIEYYSTNYQFGFLSAKNAVQTNNSAPKNNNSDKKIDGTVEALEGEVWLDKGDAANIAKNYTEALTWYRKASEKGYERASYNIGTYYYNGLGVERNYTEAMIWFKVAADKGYGKAMFNIAVMYYNGQGVGKNNTEAVNWFRKAANKGVQEAKDALKKMNVTETVNNAPY